MYFSNLSLKYIMILCNSCFIFQSYTKCEQHTLGMLLKLGYRFLFTLCYLFVYPILYHKIDKSSTVNYFYTAIAIGSILYTVY